MSEKTEDQITQHVLDEEEGMQAFQDIQAVLLTLYSMRGKGEYHA